MDKQLFNSFINEKEFYGKFGREYFFLKLYILKGANNEDQSFKGLIANFYVLNCEIEDDIIKEFTEKSKCKNDFWENLGETHINPLKSLEELEKWTPNDHFNLTSIPLKKIARKPVITFYIVF